MEGFHALPMPAKRWGSVLCWLATNYKVTAQKAVPAGEAPSSLARATVNTVWIIRRLQWHDSIHHPQRRSTEQMPAYRLLFKEAPL